MLHKRGVQPGDLLIGFEDRAGPGGDSDIVFRLDVEPTFVENLEQVSTMPRVTIATPEGGESLFGATVRRAPGLSTHD